MARKPRSCKDCKKPFSPRWLANGKKCPPCQRSWFQPVKQVEDRGGVRTHSFSPWDRMTGTDAALTTRMASAATGGKRLSPDEVSGRAEDARRRWHPTDAERIGDAEDARRAAVLSLRKNAYEAALAEVLDGSGGDEDKPDESFHDVAFAEVVD